MEHTTHFTGFSVLPDLSRPTVKTVSVATTTSEAVIQRQIKFEGSSLKPEVAALLRDLRRLGVELSVSGARLVARPADRLSARQRELIRAHKPELIACLTQAANATEDDTPHRLWLISLPDGSRFSASFTPPKSRAEVRGLYPDAEIEEETR